MEATFIKNIIDAAVEAHPSLFVVDWSVSSDNDIRVIIDGDQGVDVDAIVAISRAIEHHESMDREREDFSLSVSSPGADAPLKLPRQYAKHVGRTLKVQTIAGEEISGVLARCEGEGITLEWTTREPKTVGKGKQTVAHTLTVPYGEIKKASVVIKA